MTAIVVGSLALILALLYSRLLAASVFSGVAIAVGAYFTMYLNERGRGRTVFIISSTTTALAMLSFWMSGLRDTYAVMAGAATTIAAGFLWYYVTVEGSIHMRSQTQGDSGIKN